MKDTPRGSVACVLASHADQVLVQTLKVPVQPLELSALSIDRQHSERHSSWLSVACVFASHADRVLAKTRELIVARGVTAGVCGV